MAGHFVCDELPIGGDVLHSSSISTAPQPQAHKTDAGMIAILSMKKPGIAGLSFRTATPEYRSQSLFGPAHHN
jgi:hypothetical protein